MEWLTTSKAAKALGVSPETVRTLCRTARIQYRQDGEHGHYRISQDAIDRYIAVHTQGPESARRGETPRETFDRIMKQAQQRVQGAR